MSTITLKPQAKTMYTVAPERSHARLSLRRVLYVKFLRWIDKARAGTLARTLCRATGGTLIFTAAIAPSYLLGAIASVWGSKWLLGVCLVFVYLNYKYLLRKVRKLTSRRREGNQNTIHGVPVPELADFLMENESLPVRDTMRILGITQPQHRKIADLLEKHGVLERGESNARVLRPIARADLVKQLTENFPLEWSWHEREWVRKRDTFSMYALDRERQERKEEKRIEKRERKAHRLEKRIQELQNPFTVQELSFPLETA